MQPAAIVPTLLALLTDPTHRDRRWALLYALRYALTNSYPACKADVVAVVRPMVLELELNADAHAEALTVLALVE